MNQADLDVQAVAAVRAAWDAQFEAMAAAGDDRTLDPETHALTQWDADEWEWL